MIERKALGDLAFLDAGRETLAEYVDETCYPVYLHALGAKTQTVYAGHYDLHIKPRLGGLPLREITRRRSTDSKPT